jgi:hypothetical protein
MQIRIRDLVKPGSGVRDGKIRIRDKHPESATLLNNLISFLYRELLPKNYKINNFGW